MSFSAMSHPHHDGHHACCRSGADPSLHGNLPEHSNSQSSPDQLPCHPHQAHAAQPTTRTNTQRRQCRPSQQRRGYPPSRCLQRHTPSAARQNPNTSCATQNDQQKNSSAWKSHQTERVTHADTTFMLPFLPKTDGDPSAKQRAFDKTVQLLRSTGNKNANNARLNVLAERLPSGLLKANQAAQFFAPIDDLSHRIYDFSNVTFADGNFNTVQLPPPPAPGAQDTNWPPFRRVAKHMRATVTCHPQRLFQRPQRACSDCNSFI